MLNRSIITYVPSTPVMNMSEIYLDKPKSPILIFKLSVLFLYSSTRRILDYSRSTLAISDPYGQSVEYCYEGTSFLGQPASRAILDFTKKEEQEIYGED